MNHTAKFERPSLDHAIRAWEKFLSERGFATNLLWIFEENLCFEKAPGAPGGFQLGYQTRFLKPPEDAVDIAYDLFCDSDARVVFFRLGESHGRSVCLLLGDHWFDKKNESSGYWRRDDWGLSFFPGENKKLEEITDLSRWLGRLKRERPLHDLDFCMALATIDEVKTHGRVLAPGERFADGLVGRLRRLFSHAG
jgi:hypothetical protein